MIVGQKTVPTDVIIDAGLRDFSSVESQFSNAADIMEINSSWLDTVFSAEKYSDVASAFPIEDQMNFWQQMWSLIDALDQVLTFMLARAEAIDKGETVVKSEESKPLKLEAIPRQSNSTLSTNSTSSTSSDQSTKS